VRLILGEMAGKVGGDIARGGIAFNRIAGYLSSLRKQGVKRLAALARIFTGILSRPAGAEAACTIRSAGSTSGRRRDVHHT
jgi:hypothetical protein